MENMNFIKELRLYLSQSQTEGYSSINKNLTSVLFKSRQSISLDLSLSLNSKPSVTGLVFHFESQIDCPTFYFIKHFGLSFAYDAPRTWNDLPHDVCSAKSLFSFRKTYLFAKAYPP